ncbi:sulfatase [Halorussus salilacus]|uniref:sulfatase n=1 Tax=Halorussus salilacus TaxID=2953750 RepID=UPI00209C878B|nr:sulfatase [Halorussus salilacus]USZ68049.1 sulfatase [Halorussus salilacus]
MNPLKRFPRANNAWMDLKHRVAHWRKRRKRREFGGRAGADLTVTDPRNVLVVVLDCLRADHVSGFGHDRPTTPALDRFADEAAAFSNAKAPSSWTFPSIPSLLSGRYPHEHGGRMAADPRNLSSEQFPSRPRADVPMLPDLLESAGYDTGMVTAIPMAEEAVGDRFRHVSVRYTDASERVDAAREWLSGRDRWFCHLHLGDPHAPLDIPDEHRETFGVPETDGLEDWRFREGTGDGGDDFESYRDAKLRAYDAAIRGADDALADLLADLPDDTVVVVCGDHGEAFWEHPGLERRLNHDPRGYYATDHGHSVLEEVARVPLWVRAPGVETGVTDRPVSLVDVAPTILSALGADVPEVLGGPEDLNSADGLSGRSLAEAASDRPLLCEETAYGYNQRAVWHDGEKLVAVPETGERAAFALDGYLEGDPLDSVPDHLDAALAGFGSGVAGGERMDVDDDTRDRLAELGYLE